MRNVLVVLLISFSLSSWMHTEGGAAYAENDSHGETAGKTVAGKAVAGGEVTAGEIVTTDSGLKYKDIIVGSEKTAENGQQVKVHYSGWVALNGDTVEKGEKFDSSYDRGIPIPFVLGTGRVIKGWDEGIKGMKVGGKRFLIVPPELGYGDKPTGNSKIPVHSTLLFEVELVEVG